MSSRILRKRFHLLNVAGRSRQVEIDGAADRAFLESDTIGPRNPVHAVAELNDTIPTDGLSGQKVDMVDSSELEQVALNHLRQRPDRDPAVAGILSLHNRGPDELCQADIFTRRFPPVIKAECR